MVEDQGRGRRCEITGNPCGTDTWVKGTPCHCSQCAAWLDEKLEETESRLDEVEGLRRARDLQVVTATRLQLMQVVKEWRKSGMSVDQLLFRMKTTHIELPKTMVMARRKEGEGS